MLSSVCDKQSNKKLNLKKLSSSNYFESNKLFMKSDMIMQDLIISV